jgi:hypothetical protein
MLNHKSSHRWGLDTLIYNGLKNISCNKDYFFYIYDCCVTFKEKPNDYYNKNNNKNNTWNYNFKLISIMKENIMKDSVMFGFPDYNYNVNDDYILVKAIDHFNSVEKYGQSHIVKREKYEKDYDKSKYIGQRILKTNEKFNEELNIYIIRDLNTYELHFYSLLCINDISVNINRKKSRCEFKEVNIEDILSKEQINNFIKYMNYINIDYGRIELLKDNNLGWCLIDINDSPGGGPITNMSKNKLINIFKEIIS